MASLIGPAVVAAIISLIGVWIFHSRRVAFERAQAERRVNAEIALAERKLVLDRQLDRYKRRAQLAEQALISFYEARDVFTWVRSRGIVGGEGESRPTSDTEGEELRKRRNTYFVPIERLTREKELFARLQSLRYAFVAHFGATTSEPFKTISEVHHQITASAATVIQLTFDGDDRRTHQSSNEPLLNTLGWGPTKRPDEIDRKIESAVASIEAVCRPVLAEIPE